MANTQINIGANGTTTLATAGKYCDRNIDINVSVPDSGGGGFTPSGTKTITTNGSHDVTEYAIAQVNVPVGITPSGSLNITENGTYDVTAKASAVVNVPVPAEKTVVRTVTIGSVLGNGANSTYTLLSNDAFIKANYAKDGFSVLVVPAAPIAGESGYLAHSIYHGNRNIGATGAARYGFAYVSTSASAIAQIAMTVKISGTSYNVSLRANSSGNLVVYVASTRKMNAGTYLVIMTCTD